MSEAKGVRGEVIGREAVQARVKQALLSETWPQAVMLGGPRGIGKARLANWIAQTILCQGTETEAPCLICTSCRLAITFSHPDIVWYMPQPSIQEASLDKALGQLDEWRGEELQRWRDDVLALRSDEGVGYYALSGKAVRRETSKKPVTGSRRVIILTDAEKLANAQGEANEAANSLLKNLEEPGPGNYFILTANQPSRIPATIRSRVSFWPLGLLEPRGVREILLKGGRDAEDEDIRRGQIDQNILGGQTEMAGQAAEWLAAALSLSPARIISIAREQTPKNARGSFANTLVLLAEIIYQKIQQSNPQEKSISLKNWAEIIRRTEVAYIQAQANANPQLIIYSLLADIQDVLMEDSRILVGASG